MTEVRIMASDFLLVDKRVMRDVGRTPAIILAILNERFGSDEIIDGIDYIRSKIKISDPTVRECLAKLETAGILSRISYKDRVGLVYKINE